MKLVSKQIKSNLKKLGYDIPIKKYQDLSLEVYTYWNVDKMSVVTKVISEIPNVEKSDVGFIYRYGDKPTEYFCITIA